MNRFDYAIIGFVNQFSHRSVTLDHIIVAIGSIPLFKTAVLTVLLAWLWFRRTSDGVSHRSIMLAGLGSTCAAVLFARVLAIFMPFRERPFRNPGLHFVLPYFMNGADSVSWKTFPSDNAVLFFGIATTIYLISRRAGLLAFFHVCLVVALSRVYVGYHYPSDILAGALIGIAAAVLVQRPALKAAVSYLPLVWLERRPREFYLCFAFGLYLIATTFEPFYPAIHLVVARLRASGEQSSTTISVRAR